MSEFNLKNLLKEYLTREELELAPNSYDSVGSGNKVIAIVEIDEKLDDKEKLIADTIMKQNKNIKSVLRKLSGRKGKFRLTEYKLIAGDSDTEVIHKEHGILLKLDPRKIFFSPRELTERQRVASQVKPNETALVMFNGVSPYPIAICKKQPLVEKVYGIDINTDAHNYALENIRMNKVSHKIVLINGDVREICPKLNVKFDRIVMPLAKEGYKHLDVAVPILKKNGIIHMYYVAPEIDLFSEAEQIVREVTERFNKKFEILNKRRVLPWGSRKWKVVLDLRIYGLSNV